MNKTIERGNNCEIHKGVIIFDDVIIGDNVTIFPGAVIGRPPLSSGVTRQQGADQYLKSVKIGDGCIIGANVVIYSDVEIGGYTMVCDTACVRNKCRIGCYTLIAQGVTINQNSKIGSHVKIMDNTHITSNMTIEDRVFISTMVSTTNDNMMGRNKNNQLEGPIIRRFATLGQGCCILPGVEIGENAIVGAGAVVTKYVSPRTVVMGVPARFIRDVRIEEMADWGVSL